MFWALTMGILLGAKLYAIALVVAAAIAAIIFPIMAPANFCSSGLLMVTSDFQRLA